MPEEAKTDKINAQTTKRLEAIFTNLKSKHDKVREKAAQDLRRTLEAQIQATRAGEGMGQLEKMVNNSLFQLFRTQTDNRMGGLLALQSILDLEFLEHTVKVARFIGFITICFPTDNTKQADLAAKVLGRLASLGGPLATDVVESEAKRALEWLISDKDTLNRRYDMVWYGMVWYGMVWYGMVWYGMVWYGMVWYGMVWYGMLLLLL